MQTSGYWQGLFEAIRSVTSGLRLTWSHIWSARKTVPVHDVTKANYFANQNGIATIQYPHETIPVPDNGRYQLNNEIEDCIVCDKCAKICPVDCIAIEPIKSATEFGKTSDGTPKRIYAAKFDIDMSKCCFCGLCTTVCPTECLTMTPTYDYSTQDIREHTFVFGNMTPDDIAARKLEWERVVKEKETAAAAAPATATTSLAPAASSTKPVFKPRIKPTPPTEPTP